MDPNFHSEFKFTKGPSGRPIATVGGKPVQVAKAKKSKKKKKE